MADLDPATSSKNLGSKIKLIGPVGFGNFAAISKTEQIQKARREDLPGVEPPPDALQQDTDGAQASDGAREGAAPCQGCDDNVEAE
jgi:hypothetical protein